MTWNYLLKQNAMEQKTEVVRLRVDRAMLDLIRQESERKGWTVTTFVRDAIRHQVVRR